MLSRTLLTLLLAVLLFGASASNAWAEKRCKDRSADPAGCQPSTFDTIVARGDAGGQIPTTRLNRQGQADPFSSDDEAIAGAFRLERKLRLFRNFTHLHWVPIVPSVVDPVTGAKSGGSLDR